MTEKEVVNQLINILKNTENILKPIDEDAPEELTAFQKMQFKNYNTIKTVLKLLEKKNIRIKQLQKHNKKLDLEAQKYFEETIKQDKMIDLICEIISAIETNIPTIKKQFEKEYCEFINRDEDCCWKDDKDCKDCIKQWIKKKVNLNND